MRTYLCDFFKSFQYQKEDADILLGAYDIIVANQKTKALWNDALALYESDIHCDYNAIIEAADTVADVLDLHEYTAELLIFICLSKHLKELYIERGIDPDFYEKSIATVSPPTPPCAALILSI